MDVGWVKVEFILPRPCPGVVHSHKLLPGRHPNDLSGSDPKGPPSSDFDEGQPTPIALALEPLHEDAFLVAIHLGDAVA
jgi:hypothetical protein